MPANSGSPYRISQSAAISERLHQWGERARELGVLDRLKSLLKETEAALTTRPAEWGDPVRNLRHLKIVMYRRLIEFMIVEYGVHEDAKIVFIRDFRLIPENPLGL